MRVQFFSHAPFDIMIVAAFTWTTPPRPPVPPARCPLLPANAVATLMFLFYLQEPDRALCNQLQTVAERRPKVFREPELLEAVSELLTGRGTKTAIQPASGREGPCVAQAAACGILAAALKARNWIQTGHGRLARV